MGGADDSLMNELDLALSKRGPTVSASQSSDPSPMPLSEAQSEPDSEGNPEVASETQPEAEPANAELGTEDDAEEPEPEPEAEFEAEPGVALDNKPGLELELGTPDEPLLNDPAPAPVVERHVERPEKRKQAIAL